MAVTFLAEHYDVPVKLTCDRLEITCPNFITVTFGQQNRISPSTSESKWHLCQVCWNSLSAFLRYPLTRTRWMDDQKHNAFKIKVLYYFDALIGGNKWLPNLHLLPLFPLSQDLLTSIIQNEVSLPLKALPPPLSINSIISLPLSPISSLFLSLSLSLRRKWIPTKYNATGMHHYAWPSTPLHSGWGGWERQSERGTRGRERDTETERQRERYQTIDGYERRGGRGRGRLPVTKQLLCQKNQEDQTYTHTRTQTHRHTHTHKHIDAHTHMQSKQGGGSMETSGSRSVRTMLLRMTTAY